MSTPASKRPGTPQVPPPAIFEPRPLVLKRVGSMIVGVKSVNFLMLDVDKMFVPVFTPLKFDDVSTAEKVSKVASSSLPK